MWKIDIHGEIHFIKHKEDFVRLVEQNMGYDAANWLKLFIQEGLDYQNNLSVMNILEDMRDELNLKIDLAIENVEKRIEEEKQDNGLTMWG